MQLQLAKIENLKSNFDTLNYEITSKNIQINEIQNEGKNIGEERKKYLQQINLIQKKIEDYKNKINQINVKQNQKKKSKNEINKVLNVFFF